MPKVRQTTVNEHPNAVLFREVSSKVDAGDVHAMVATLADEVIWHEVGSDQPLIGKAVVRERLASGGIAQVEFDSRLHAVVADDEHIIALVGTTAARGGRSLTYRTAEIMHVRNGKVTERWAFSDDTARIIEFLG